MGWQPWEQALLLIFSLCALGVLAAYSLQPAGIFVQFIQSMWIDSLKLCLHVADVLESAGAGLFSSWQKNARNRWLFTGPQPPRYLVYTVKLIESGAEFLRCLGGLLARGAITYRNLGSVYRPWPARFVVTAGGLFTSDWVEKLSFIPTWCRHVIG